MFEKLRGSAFLLALKFYVYNSFASFFPSHKLRLWYLRKVLKISIGQHTSIGMGCFFAGNHIVIGDHTVINRKVYFDGRVASIRIGNNVSVSQETNILTMSHDPRSTDFSAFSQDVVLKDYVWTGFRSIILPGVILGEGSVVGANSLVTKSLDAYGIYVGSPAKKISERNCNLDYTLDYFPYFNTDIQR
ncbi:acyltransferase [Sphingobacterium sp. PCS056]|uniref:acyltransferase n=1 Tax=Sphingobacterium sp. PCS056 TaxID=2931400 RepID=UPI00200FE20B|nr:acyltransferase [Sphingobacterium sp. PCS056]UPZ37822.1 acyltransferase [Sphingobacterium sp. PCS056]